MSERILILVVIAAAVAVIWLGLRWRSSRIRRRGAMDLLRLEQPAPLVLAFSTPECVPCRTQQRPALAELLRRYPDLLEVREVDATVQPHLAERFGIMTVPTTVVVNQQGRIVAINHGVTRWERLASQLHLNGAHAPSR
ncbi:MAG: thioredoxin family protein [bacterium]